MFKKLSSKDWMRMLVAFLLGVAVSFLIMQFSGSGGLFQGYLAPSKTYTIVKPVSPTSSVIDAKLGIPPEI